MMTIQSPTQRANRRRLLVFLGVFLALAAIGLVYTYARPAQYRAAARVQINPGAVQVQSVAPTGGSQGVDSQRPLLSEVQVLTSRPVVEATVARLRQAFGERASLGGPDALAKLQGSLAIEPAGGTDIVEVASIGPEAEIAAALVNGVVATYAERLDASYRNTSDDSLAQAADEVAKLEARVLAKRRAVEEFRLRHNIVSLERDENEALAKARGLGTSLNSATDKLALAEGKLRSLTESTAAGRPLARGNAGATLANLEQRASQIREELSELARTYTQDYLAMDTRVKAQRARLAELERQIVTQRQRDREAAVDEREVAIADAKEEVAGARESVARIQQQIAANRGALQHFTARFNEYKILRDELAPLEALHRDAIQRKARLEAGERARRPWVRVLEEAVVPREVWRPMYTRDAGIALGLALLVGLLAMWVVELFNKSDPQPMLLVPRPGAFQQMGMAPGDALSLPGRGSPPALGRNQGRYAIDWDGREPTLPSGLPEAAAQVPRELTDDELTRLLKAADDGVRVAVLLLLSGLTPDETGAARWDELDTATGTMTIAGAYARTVELTAPVVRQLATACGNGSGLMVKASNDAPAAALDLAARLLFAAHDASIVRPTEVTPEALRHTYIAFLARQGVRMGDLSRLVGRITAEQAAIYVAYAPEGARRTLAEIRRVMGGVLNAESVA